MGMPDATNESARTTTTATTRAGRSSRTKVANLTVANDVLRKLAGPPKQQEPKATGGCCSCS